MSRKIYVVGKFCKSKCHIFPLGLISLQLNLPALIQRTSFKEIQTGSWYGTFYLVQKPPTRPNWISKKTIQNAAAAMAITYCPVKLTTDYLPTIKLSNEEEKYPSSYYRGKRHIVTKLRLLWSAVPNIGMCCVSTTQLGSAQNFWLFKRIFSSTA